MAIFQSLPSRVPNIFAASRAGDFTSNTADDFTRENLENRSLWGYAT